MDEGSSTCSIQASVYADGVSWVGAVNNRSFGVTINGQRYAMQKSNEKHLLYRVDGGMIYFLEDTTWANTVQCTTAGGGSSPAMGRIFQSGTNNPGGNFVARDLSCGETTSINGYNRAYEYNPTYESNPLGAANECSSQFTGELGSTNQLIYHGAALCLGQPIEAMVLRNISGAGVGEVFVFAAGKGLAAWYQTIDFSKPENQPRNWTAATDLCSGFGQSQNICEVDTQYVNEKIPLTVTTSIADGLDSLTGGFLNISRSIASLKPATPEYITPHLWYGPWFAEPEIEGRAAANDYMSWMVKDRYVMSTRQHTMSFKSQICKADGKIIKGEKLIESSTIPEIPVADDGSEYLTASMGLGKVDPNRPGQVVDNNDKLPEKMALTEGDCNEELSGSPPTMKQYQALGENPYGGIGGAVLNVVLQIAQSIIDLLLGGQSQSVSVGHVQSWQYMSRSPAIAQNVNNLADSHLPDIMTEPPIDEISRVDNSYVDPLGNRNTIETSTNLYNAELKAQMLRCRVLSYQTQDQHPELGCSVDYTFGKQNTTVSAPVTPGGTIGDAIDIAAQCSYDGANLSSVADEIRRNFTNPAALAGSTDPNLRRWGIYGAQNFSQFYQQVQSMAASAGTVPMNPAFALALWIEETAASGVNDTQSWALGCRGDRNASYAADNPDVTLEPGEATNGSAVMSHVRTQVDCLTRFVISRYNGGGSDQEKSQNYLRFLCHWRYGNPTCSPGSVAGLHARVMRWYQRVSPSCGMLSAPTAGANPT